MDRPGQREEDLPRGRGPPQLGFVHSLALRLSAAPHPGIFPWPPGHGWPAERSSLTGPPSLPKISKAPVNPMTAGSSNGWQSEEAITTIQELARVGAGLERPVKPAPQSGSWKSRGHFRLESFWLPACPQLHFCFKDEIYGNRLAVGKHKAHVPCSAPEIIGAHRVRGWAVGQCLSCPHFRAGMKGQACLANPARVVSFPCALSLISEVLSHSWLWPRCHAVPLCGFWFISLRALGLHMGPYTPC